MLTTDLLARVSLFHALSPEDLGRISEAAHPVEFDEGDLIVEVGDPGSSLFVIVEGSVEVLHPGRNEDVQLAQLGPGDFFGEAALLNARPRSATVRAATPVRAFELGQEAFRGVISESPTAAIQIMEILSVRIRDTEEQIGAPSDLAQRDPLTRLLNRRALTERLAEECDRHRRYGSQFSLVLIDVDRFPDLHEMFGQAMGDATLAWIGRLLLEHTRESDVAFRIGGEAFAILCPSTVGEAARYMAQRLVELVAQARPPLSFDLRVTISAGLTVCPTHGVRSDDLVQAAQSALEQAKSDGRNRVSVAAELAPGE